MSATIAMVMRLLTYIYHYPLFDLIMGTLPTPRKINLLQKKVGHIIEKQLSGRVLTKQQSTRMLDALSVMAPASTEANELGTGSDYRTATVCWKINQTTKQQAVAFPVVCEACFPHRCNPCSGQVRTSSSSNVGDSEVVNIPSTVAATIEFG